MKNIIDILSEPLGEFQREVCLMYTKQSGFFGLKTDNLRGSVEFDFQEVFYDLMFGKFHEITMIHTHPPGILGMSSTDVELVKSWSMGINKPIHFWIFPHNEEMLCYNHITRHNKITTINTEMVQPLKFPFENFRSIRHLRDILIWFSSDNKKYGKQWSSVLDELNSSDLLKSTVDILNKDLVKDYKKEDAEYNKIFSNTLK